MQRHAVVITTLRASIGRQVQGLFTPCSGSFLSLKMGSLSVSQGVFALRRDGPRSFTARFLVPRATQDATEAGRQSVCGTITLYGRPFQGVPLAILLPSWSTTTPCRPERHEFETLPCSLSPTYGIIVYFLLLHGYLDVSVPRSPPYGMAGLQPAGFAPFGYPGIKGYLRLPQAFAAYPRPSSPPSQGIHRLPLLTFLSPRTYVQG